jgi:hypothetical protein
MHGTFRHHPQHAAANHIWHYSEQQSSFASQPHHSPTCQLTVHAVGRQDEVIGWLESHVAAGIRPVQG